MMTETEYRNAVANLKVDDNVKAKLLEAHKKYPDVASAAVGIATSVQNGDRKGLLQHGADFQASVKKQAGQILSKQQQDHEVGARTTHQLFLDFLNFFKMLIELLEELFFKLKDEVEKLANKIPAVKKAEGLIEEAEKILKDTEHTVGKIEHALTHPVDDAEAAGTALVHGIEHIGQDLEHMVTSGNDSAPKPPGMPPSAPRPG